jgi:hypothetical protein
MKASKKPMASIVNALYAGDSIALLELVTVS